MNIRSRLKDPSTEDRTVDQGFSLIRRTYDNDLLAKCAELAARRSDLINRSDMDGRNALAINTLLRGDIAANANLKRTLGGLGVRSVLYKMLEEVPSLSERWRLTVSGLIVRQDPRNIEGLHYVEAVFDRDDTARLKEEVDNIRSSLRGWANEGDPAFAWARKVPLDLSVASTSTHASAESVKSLEQVANEVLRPPFKVQLTEPQLILPGLKGK